MTVGDLTSQLTLQQNKQIDLNQTVRFALAGLIFVGPAVRGCLVMIDKFFGPTTSLKILAKKLFVDQCLCAPSFLVGNISTLTIIKTGSIEEVKNELEQSYFKLLKLNYSFWPFVQVINFYFIPLTYRVLFGSSAALAYNTLFSYRLHEKSNQISSSSSSDNLHNNNNSINNSINNHNNNEIKINTTTTGDIVKDNTSNNDSVSENIIS